MKKNKLDIVYEDKDLLVVNKPSHLLTISTNNEKEKTLYHQVYLYLKKKNKQNKVFIVHRLDKDTSGLIIFSKSEKVKYILQNNWDKVIRKYVCVVHGNMEKESDTLKDYLKETKTLLVYVSNNKDGKLAITKYNKVESNNKYSLLSIEIKTGLKNQIRVQLNNINHPIVGDKKYNLKKDNYNRLCLHANYLEFNHPINNKKIILTLDTPKPFIELLKIDK